MTLKLISFLLDVAFLLWLCVAFSVSDTHKVPSLPIQAMGYLCIGMWGVTLGIAACGLRNRD